MSRYMSGGDGASRSASLSTLTYTRTMRSHPAKKPESKIDTETRPRILNLSSRILNLLSSSTLQKAVRGTGKAMLTSILQDKLAYAKNLVDHWPLTVLSNIVHGYYPAEFSTFTPLRIGVYERAALIVLETRTGNHPESADYWSRQALEQRILMQRRGIYTPKPNRVSTLDDPARDNERRRAIAQSGHIDGDTLDDRWG